MTFIIIIHVAICFGLIGLVLIQRGRGSGLVESFQGVESMFGTKTNAFLTRSTTILSILFFITCLSLAVLSVRQSRSLLRNVRTQAPQAQPPQQVTESKPAATETKPAATETKPLAAETKPIEQKETKPQIPQTQQK